MFRLDLSPTFKAKVEFSIVGADGSMQAHEFAGTFVRFTVDEMVALAKQAMDEKWPERKLAAQLISGWEGVGDSRGNSLPFTPENLAAVLNVDGIATAVLRAHRAASQGADLGN